MRLVLVDLAGSKRTNFHPLALSRPIFQLRCGMTTLGEKLLARLGAADVACFVPPYLAESVRAGVPWPVNDPATLRGDDLLIINGRVKAAELALAPLGPSVAAFDADGETLFLRVARDDVARLDATSIESFIESAKRLLPTAEKPPAAWNYIWELVLANAEQLKADFAAAGCSGIEGTVEQPNAIRGGRNDFYVAPGAVVHPMTVIDCERGPVYIDRDAVIHPFTRIEGPCYIGRGSMLLGCKCRAGNSIGPMCRLGGEVEESIVHGYSNKYHEGFLGHAYVGQWVNLGALTANSDLKNDYSEVSVVLDGRKSINTGSTKVGSLIGDHAKTSIGTLLNTGAYVGAMSILTASGKLLPKFLPSFGWYIDGMLSEGFGRQKLYQTARAAMERRGRQWTTADENLWNAIYELTAASREAAIRRGAKKGLA
jgi:UDP-N-acetylglucosamine diphosphorylase/glucosamine-1-phosphate N-acetyltransferase